MTARISVGWPPWLPSPFASPLVAVLLRRLLFGVFVLWGITVITFLLSHVIPGNPVALLAGPHASAAAIEATKRRFGLDGSLPEQYWTYVRDLAHLQLGYSFVNQSSVGHAIGEFLPATIELSLFALIVGTAIGLPIGVLCAGRRGRAADLGGRFGAAISLSIPAFTAALLLQYFFYARLGWLPGTGELTSGASPPSTITHLYVVDAALAGQWSTFWDALKHLVLPGMSLAIGIAGFTVRVVRTSMLEVLGEDYVRTARAKGLSGFRILMRHTLRNGLLPLVTVLGLEFAALAGGVFLIEQIFSWPGLGRFALQAINATDDNSLIGVTLVIAVIYVVINLIVDLSYAVLDPRIRLR